MPQPASYGDEGIFLDLLQKLSDAHVKEVAYWRDQTDSTESRENSVHSSVQEKLSNTSVPNGCITHHVKKISPAPLPPPAAATSSASCHEFIQQGSTQCLEDAWKALGIDTTVNSHEVPTTSVQPVVNSHEVPATSMQPIEPKQHHVSISFDDTTVHAFCQSPSGSSNTSSHLAKALYSVRSPTMSVHTLRSVKTHHEIEALLESAEETDVQKRAKHLIEEGYTQNISTEILLSVTIFSNVVQMGISLDVHSEWSGWIVIDSIFAAVFFVEMVLKMFTTGSRNYFCGPLRAWNLFDASIVFLGIAEIFTLLAERRSLGTTEGAGGLNITLLRVFRILRLTRLVRLLRSRAFKELKMMCSGFAAGGRTLLWSSIFLLTALYPMALFLRSTLGEENYPLEVRKNFETVASAWFTVFRCVMGDCADDTGRPIFNNDIIPWYYKVAYCFIVVLFVFGVFNVIVAIYVENTSEAGRHNLQLQRQRRLTDRNMRAVLTRALVDYFEDSADARRQGKKEITKESFQESMMQADAHGLFDQLDVAEEDRLDLFEILDADGRGVIGIDELVNGIFKLRGPARRSDIVACRLVLASMIDQMKDFHRIMYRESAQVKATLSQLLPRGERRSGSRKVDSSFSTVSKSTKMSWA